MSKLCGYCGQEFEEESNHADACRYHPQFYFPYDIDKEGIHKKGWQCCGSIDPGETGCVITPHRDDVKKIFHKNSIAYDYAVIDHDKERLRKELLSSRAVKLKENEKNPETAPLISRIRSFSGKKLSQLKEFAGEPFHSAWISNGTSGFVHHCKTAFFRYQDLFWIVRTDYEPIGYDENREGREYDFTIESITFYADQDAINEYRSGMITDLTGD